MKLTFLILVLFASPGLLAQSACDKNGDSSKLLTINEPTAPRPSSLGQNIRVLIWNIHKGDDPRLPSDFKKISSQSDFVLLQEFISAPRFTSSIVRANPTLGWTMAKSFIWMDGSYTGVATASRVRPLCQLGLRSTVTEPLLDSPKTVLISEYPISGSSQRLLVANIHAINFVSTETFEKHIQQLLRVINTHQGPMIVAGDFNTWNNGRSDYLFRKMKFLGLREAHIPSDELLKLDHIFIRGLAMRQSFQLSQVESSDHTPLLVDLSLLEH